MDDCEPRQHLDCCAALPRRVPLRHQDDLLPLAHADAVRVSGDDCITVADTIAVSQSKRHRDCVALLYTLSYCHSVNVPLADAVSNDLAYSYALNDALAVPHR